MLYRYGFLENWFLACLIQILTLRPPWQRPLRPDGPAIKKFCQSPITQIDYFPFGWSDRKVFAFALVSL